MYCIKNSNILFENLRDRFLAAIFTNNPKETEAAYSSILSETIKAQELSEHDQKTVNQVQHAFAHFFPEIKQNCSEEIISTNKKLRHILSGIVRKSVKYKRTIDYNDWKNKAGLSEKLLETLFKTTTTLQVTTGCSNYCRRCNEWAIPGSRKHFSYSTVTFLTKKFFAAKNSDFVYYSASDPLDWQDGDKDISDVINYLSNNKFIPQHGLLTKVPNGKEKLLKQLIANDTDISISVTARNRNRIKKIEEQTGIELNKQHDSDKLLIPACLDEDFSTVKSTINDNYGTEITPDGAFITMPAFTSALNLTGQQRIPINRDTVILPSRKTGRNALSVVYFKPIEVTDLKGNTYKLKSLLPVQIENILLDIDSETVTPPGIMNIKEYFKTFSPDAIVRRKNMFQTVIKNFKAESLENNTYRTSPNDQRNKYKHKVLEYQKFCHPGHVQSFKKYSFSFFLKSITSYVRENPDRSKIILHLRKKDKTAIFKKLQSYINETDIDLLFCNSKIDSYDLFQLLYFRLLDSPDDDSIRSFIKRHPSKYDDITDMFCRASI